MRAAFATIACLFLSLKALAAPAPAPTPVPTSSDALTLAVEDSKPNELVIEEYFATPEEIAEMQALLGRNQTDVALEERDLQARETHTWCEWPAGGFQGSDFSQLWLQINQWNGGFHLNTWECRYTTWGTARSRICGAGFGRVWAADKDWSYGTVQLLSACYFNGGGQVGTFLNVDKQLMIQVDHS